MTRISDKFKKLQEERRKAFIPYITAGDPDLAATEAMIVALARKLLIALWRYVTIGKVPAGAVLRPAT